MYGTVRRLYRRMNDSATAPNERDACQTHIDRLLLRHGLTLMAVKGGDLDPRIVRMKPRKHGVPDQASETVRIRTRKVHTRDARRLDTEQLFDIIRYHNAGWTNADIETKVPATRQWIGRFLRSLNFEVKRGRRVK